MTSRYVLRRLLQIPVTVVAIVVLGFVLIHAAPSDPILALAGESGDTAYYELMRSKFGLDRPLPEQLLVYAGNVLRGDLGVSFTQGRPVSEIIIERLPATLLLMTVALLISSVVGIAAGAIAAHRPFGKLDLGISLVSLVGFAIPSFWLAQLALLFLAFGTGLFPVGGMTDAGADDVGFARALDIAQHLILPALVLATHELALTTRLTRTRLLEELSSDYIVTARAKGLRSFGVLRHALPNALLPVITVLGTRVGFLFSGAVLVELVFAWPGLGRLLLRAGEARDYPILLGIFLLVSISVVIANLVTDLIYARLDPRVRYG